jgi:hypothetical protein
MSSCKQNYPSSQLSWKKLYDCHFQKHATNCVGNMGKFVVSCVNPLKHSGYVLQTSALVIMYLCVSYDSQSERHFFSIYRIKQLVFIMRYRVFPVRKELKTKLHGLSPRANYTDWATAACWWSDCQLFADRGCHVVSTTGPYGRSLGFLDRNRYFSFK